MLLFGRSSTDIPLSLSVSREGVGGVTGLSPTVAIRDAATLNSYLDWGDNTFKTSGWSTKYAAVSEVERGHYRRLFDASLVVSLQHGSVLSVEFHVDNGEDVVGDDADLLVLVDSFDDTVLLRKAMTNRLEEFPGNPGTLILWDDDGVTPLLQWELRDVAGNGILATAGTPSKRNKAT